MKTMKTKLLILLMIVSLYPAIRPKYGGRLVLEIASPVRPVQPDLSHWPLWLTASVYEPLFTTHESDTLEPFISQYAYDSLFMSCRIRLRDSLQFSNGDYLNPFDLINGWMAYMDEAPIKWRPLFHTVRGFEEKVKGLSGTIAGLTIVDNQTLNVEFNLPDPQFHLRLAAFKFPVLKAAEKGNRLIGTGPFGIKTIGAEKLLLTFNRFFRQGVPFLTSAAIHFKSQKNRFIPFQTGRVSGMAITTDKELSHLKRYIKDPVSLVPLSRHLCFVKVADTLAMDQRRHILSAIDRKAIYPTLVPVSGTPSEGLFGPPTITMAALETQYSVESLRIGLDHKNQICRASGDGLFVQLLKKGMKAEMVELKGDAFYKGLEGEGCDLVIAIDDLGAGTLNDYRRFFCQYFEFDNMKADSLALMAFERELILSGRFFPLFEVHEQLLAKPSVIRFSPPTPSASATWSGPTTLIWL